MSLHQLAQQVQSKGRGEDTQLIHMTPGEVQGLQSLAMKHGGSLTINPQTGLPEAGFLSSILPTLLGVGLSFIPGVGPLMAAGIVGGGTALSTGSLQKGLMAGLGAYGGAGLGASLAGAGAAAGTGIGASGAAVPGVMGASAAPMATAATPALGGSMMAGAPTSALGTGFASSAPSLTAPVASTFAPQLTAANQALQIAQPAATFGSNAAAAQRGLQGLNSLDALKTFGKDNLTNIGMAATPMLMAQNKLKAPDVNQGMIRPYTMERTQNPEAYQNNAGQFRGIVQYAK